MWKNPKRKKEYQKQYYYKNKIKLLKHNKRWKSIDYRKNPEKYRLRSAKYRLEHLDYYRKYRREWRWKRPEGIWDVLRTGAQRRNKKLNISRKEFILWWKNQEKRCFYCRVSVQELQKLKDSMSTWCKRLTIDRLDNSKSYNRKNIVLACRRCNCIKGDFFTWQEMKEIGEKYVRPKRKLVE